jgi:membrane protein
MAVEVEMTPRLRRFWRLIKIAGASAYGHDFFESAKGVAYSALFSFFPVLTTLAALLVVLRAQVTERMISSFLYRVAPPGTEDVMRNLFVVHGQRPNYLLVIAVALSAWAASSAIASLMGGFHLAYHIPSNRSFLRERAIAIGLVFASFVPVCLACGLVIFGAWLERQLLLWLPWIGQHPHLDQWALVAGQILGYAIAFCAFVFVAALLYYVGPNRKQSFEGVIPGAILATSLWMAATLAVAWYFQHVTNYNVLYGSVGAGLALLLWMYVLGLVALFGCEFNAARERIEAAARESDQLEPAHSRQ